MDVSGRKDSAAAVSCCCKSFKFVFCVTQDCFLKRGLICIDGVGKHPSNNWPGEGSVLVLGLDLEAAKSLGRHYEQHAFVWAAGDGLPELVQPIKNAPEGA